MLVGSEVFVAVGELVIVGTSVSVGVGKDVRVGVEVGTRIATVPSLEVTGTGSPLAAASTWGKANVVEAVGWMPRKLTLNRRKVPDTHPPNLAAP